MQKSSTERQKKQDVGRESIRSSAQLLAQDARELEKVVRLSDTTSTAHYQAWFQIFHLAALAELTSFFFNDVLQDKEEKSRILAAAEAHNKRWRFRFWKKDSKFIPDLVPEQCVDWMSCRYKNTMTWMQTHETVVSWVFCIVWTIHGLIQARAIYSRMAIKSSSKKTTSSDSKKEWHAILAATLRFVFYLSLLPIGFFYLTSSEHLSMPWYQDPKPTYEVVDNEIHKIQAEGKLYDDNRYCFMYLCILRTFRLLARTIKPLIKSQVIHSTKQISKRIASFALFNPRRFRRHLRQALHILRWLKYLAPCIGTANKLKASISLLLKNMKQRRQMRIMRRINAKEWNSLSPEQKEEVAAKRIQRNYRRRMAKKQADAMRLVLKKKQDEAALWIQKNLRIKAAKARANIKKKKQDLMNHVQNRNSIKPRTDDRIRNEEEISELRNELRDHLKRQKQSLMLLRPDTIFVVIWRLLFVLCVLSELSSKVFKPYFDGDTSYIWYDEGPWMIIQTIWCSFVDKIYLVMGCIGFLDVFVTFFIGKINSENGLLEPKPFMERWILPGMALQLLVNPKMADVYKVVKMSVLKIMTDVGIARFYRWYIALLLPIMVGFTKWFQMNIWLELRAWARSPKQKTSQ